MTQESPRDGLDPPNVSSAGLSHAPEAVQTLKLAMRRARFDDAERVGALADLRESKIGRLELLQDALKPLFAQVPSDVDMFDVGIMPGSTPRLFIDMIGFIEMGRDGRLYRFLQDTRHNRVTIAESAEVDTIVQAVTDYVARRLLEREKALAWDALETPQPAGGAAAASEPAAMPEPASPPVWTSTPPVAVATKRGALDRAAGWGGIAFGFVIDLLGATAFFLILVVAGWLLWNHFHG